MGLDFDVLEFCKKLRQDRPPPYQCPLEKCDRVYKSLCGLQYHLVNYDHDNPTAITPTIVPSRKKGRSRAPVPTGDIALQSPPKEALTFAEAQKVVQFEIDGKISRISIDQVLPVVSLEEWTKKNSELEKPYNFTEPVPEPHIKLPEASYKILEDYNIADAPPRPNAYIRFIEKSAEELDGEVEYDVDEEDTAWLSILNDKRQKQNMPPVSVDTLELLMDRLEKESYFQAAQSGQSSGTVVDEDAVCCICMDGECQNTNVILFCDMCNLAVHQDCYGVPYIPEGQWLCRRCLQSPSRLVDCVLCPNTGGAFKQTDRGNWAHVVCALWIPEVRFANTVFLEPIDSIETIPMARWKLTCYVCKQRGVGACIQCHKANCYAAFHVTCAQHAGLHMKMDAVNGPGRGGALDASQSIQVAKMAYCDAHTPAGAQRAARADSPSLEDPPASMPTPKKHKLINKIQARTECREKMKQARRMLAKKRCSVPVVLIPTIPPDRVQEIASLVQLAGKAPFVQRLIAYWTLKRQYRNGVPLLRRLQSLNHHTSGGNRGAVQEGSVDTRELYNQLKYWQRIRQDLERARLLCELVRKRERMKAEHTRVTERWLLHQLKPEEATLRKLLNLIQAKDTSDIFSEPVDPTEVPDYSSVVTHPMDLSTMSQKLNKGLYTDLDILEKDFSLMIANCLAYNSKDTVFYKAGIKMMEQGSALIKQAHKDMLEAGYIDKEALKAPPTPPYERTPSKKFRERRQSQSQTTPLKEDLAAKIEEELNLLMDEKNPSEESLQMLNGLAVKWKKSGGYQNSPRLARRLRSVLQTAELKTPGSRKRRRRRGQSEGSGSEEEAEREGILALPPRGAADLPLPLERTPSKRSPPPPATGEPSPTGVNRRTAVLFTRKGQTSAAFSQLRGMRLAELTGAPSPPVSAAPSPLPSLAPPLGLHLLATDPHQDIGLTLEAIGLAPSGIGSDIPAVKKKGRGRPRKHKEKVNPMDKSRLAIENVLSGERLSSLGPQLTVPASFLQYRGPRDEVGSGVDSDSARSSRTYSSSCSSCTHHDHHDMSSCSDSCSMTSGSDRSSCFNETMESTTNATMSDDENLGKSGNSRGPGPARRWSSDLSETGGRATPRGRKRGRAPKAKPKGEEPQLLDSSTLAPLQLVWAKCRGYPWYPALIIDPKIPKGFIHNGVPLPVPPQDVLNLKKNHANEPILFLVLFFDAKRTWQWLPPNKLELLGIKKSIDQAKLVESRKPTDRKAVKKAYQDAMQYRKQVDGEPLGTAK